MIWNNNYITASVLVLVVIILSLTFFYSFRVLLKEGEIINNYGEIKNKNDLLIENNEENKEFQQINFLGDVMLARHVEYLMSEYGADYPFRSINFIDPEKDYTFANFEASIPIKHVKTPNFGFNFSVNPQYLGSLKRAGVTHLSLANNHAFDFGYDGFKNSRLQLEKNNLISFGQPNDLSTSSITYVSLSKHKVAVIAIHSVFTLPKEADLINVINQAKDNSDLQVIFIHWGVEYERKQAKNQRLLAKKFSELGIDLVIGHHPHVVQGIERINNTLVVYSLGNFIFDQYFNKDVRQGLVVQLIEKEGLDLELNLIPVTSENTLAQPVPMSDDEREEFLTELSQYSDLEIQDNIKSGKINLDSQLATSTEKAIIAR